MNIEDCTFYDDATSDKTSNYPIILREQNASYSFTNHDNVYDLHSTANQGFLLAGIYQKNLADDFIFELDMKATELYPAGDGVWINAGFKEVNGNNRITNILYQNRVLSRFDTPYTILSEISGSFPINNWYHMKYTVENGEINLKITDSNDNLLIDTDYSIPSALTTNVYCFIGAYQTKPYHFKNLKIKSL